MCTLTFVPTATKFLLASNRDESSVRLRATPPQVAASPVGLLLYPQDGLAGGTWILVRQKGDVLVLLNGAFVRHEQKPPYRRSRGLILLDIAQQSDPAEAFAKINLTNIEPFSIVYVPQNGRELVIWRWDGQTKHEAVADGDEPHIWSSATLYTPEVVAERRRWFQDWLEKTPHPTLKDLMAFHHFGGNGDLRISLRMNRDNRIMTQSITGVEMSANGLRLLHQDLSTGDTSFHHLSLLEAAIAAT